MSATRVPGPLGLEDYTEIVPAMTAGSLGMADCADPDIHSEVGDSAGVAGLLGGGTGPGIVQPISMPMMPVVVTAAPANTLTPERYARRYRNLEIPFVESDSGVSSRLTIDMHRYGNNGIPGRRSNMGEKDRLVSLVKAELRRRGEADSQQVQPDHVKRIAHAFFAKGRPEDYALALVHALRFGRTQPGSLQHYCDTTAKLGLDCSGFVNNFLLEIGKISEPRTISTYGRGRLRQRTEEVQPLDVLLWLENDGSAGGHIAIVDSIGPDSGAMRVVESSGSKKGLASTVYRVLEARNGVFRVDRGPKANGEPSTSWVKIAAV